jgi:hypothetical protein
MRAWSPAFALLLLVTACTPSKPTGADYLGVWTGAIDGCECMLNVAAYGGSFMIRNENGCRPCSTFEGVYTLTADGNLTGGSTGVVTLVYDRTKESVTLRSGSALRSLKKLNSQALTRWRFAQQLVARYAFQIDARATELCSVRGEAGRCKLAPFRVAGSRSGSCDMFATARYAGDCVEGTLSGLCLISGVDHVAGGDVAMGYFVGGRVLYPTFIADTSDTTSPFGLQVDERTFYDCHSNFSSDNERYGCMSFRAIFGDDIFSRETHDSLRNGTFNLAKYRGILEQRATE